MGQRSFKALPFGEREMNILMAGMDGDGKSTLLKKLNVGNFTSTAKSAVHVEKWEYMNNNVSITVWTVGDKEKANVLLNHTIDIVHGLIFVIDSNDRKRLEEARIELHRLLHEEPIKQATLLVFVEKQELSTSVSTGEIMDQLEMGSLKNRKWYLQIAHYADELIEGVQWLTKNSKTRRVKSTTSSKRKLDQPS